MTNYTEFNKAVELLTQKGIAVTVIPSRGGKDGKIAVIEALQADFAIDPSTYGSQDGLLEACGDLLDEKELEKDDVLGWLTAEDVVERVTRAISA